MNPKKPLGAPPKYSESDKADIIEKICTRIAAGESLNRICADADMPCYSLVARWLGSSADFVDKYARARQAQADHYADQIVQIADEEVDPQKARVRIDARKWFASKVAPKKWGDKIIHEGGETPHRVEIAWGPPSE